MMSLFPSITLRIATSEDRLPLEELAALDCAERLPGGPALVAEVEGRLRAALFLNDGSTIANPFSFTALLVDLLRTHAELLRVHGQPVPASAERDPKGATMTTPTAVPTTAATQSRVTRVISWARDLWAELDYTQRRSLELRLGDPFSDETRDRATRALIEELNALYAYEPPSFERE